MMEQYNKQASDYIFRENNAVGRVDSDTIDLHGQYVEEAEDILEARIKYAQQHGQNHLHVYVVIVRFLLITAPMVAAFHAVPDFSKFAAYFGSRNHTPTLWYKFQCDHAYSFTVLSERGIIR